MARKTRKQKRKRGGGSEFGISVFGIRIAKSNPSVIDGRTCYQIGPIKWCTRKK